MKLLLYCTKAKPYLQVNRCVLPKEYDRYILDKKQYYSAFGEPLEKLNGKIVAESDFEVEDIELVRGLYIPPYLDTYNYVTKTIKNNTLIDKACVTYQEMEKYFGKLNYGGKNGYAIHIKNLHIFDVSKELSYYNNKQGYRIYTSPQNMCYAYDNIQLINKFIIISIRPEWLYKILNGEKTIEVRKKVLKGMLK